MFDTKSSQIARPISWLWPCLLTTKLSCSQKSNLGHTNAGHKKLKALSNELLKKNQEKGFKEGALNPVCPIPINNKPSKGFKFAMALSGPSFKSLMKPKDLQDFLKTTKAL